MHSPWQDQPFLTMAIKTTAPAQPNLHLHTENIKGTTCTTFSASAQRMYRVHQAQVVMHVAGRAG